MKFSEINMAGNIYKFEWHEGMDTYLVTLPDTSFVKLGKELAVALKNLWLYVTLPACFSGNESAARLHVERKIRADLGYPTVGL